MRGIPTSFRGINYRSRLEAKWAAFFTSIGWSFTYEPFDTDGYIPDFLIHGDSPLLVEIKPAVVEADYWQHVDKLTRGLSTHWSNDILILGADPLPCIPSDFDHDLHPTAGILGESMRGHQHADVFPDWEFYRGSWCECVKCGAYSVFHQQQSYRCRPCGHHDGDHYLGWASRIDLRSSWNDAANSVQWQGLQLNTAHNNQLKENTK